jgi:uncharacterized protein (DUF58 family)
VIDTLNRHGDPFDIKSYHPSDGIKRIIWKAYAKRGELLSRHPEASMTPEGYIVIHALASTNDDQLCAFALSYVRMLTELQLDIVFGCEGFGTRTPARNEEQAEKLLIESVWDTQSDTSLQGDAARLLDLCSNPSTGTRIEKLVVFCSASRLETPAEAKRISDLANALTDRGVKPAFCVLPTPRTSPATGSTYVTRALSWLYLTQPERPRSTTPATYNSFMTLCMQREWEVFV